MAHSRTQPAIDLSPLEIRLDADGRRRVIAIASVASGEIIIPVIGELRPTPSRYSIQIGEDAHLDDLGIVESTNHSCEPSAFIDFTDPERLSLRAVRDLPVGAEVTIHYCATEENMTSPFQCDCGAAACYGRVRGYQFLSSSRRERLDGWLSSYLRSKYDA